MCFFFSKKIYKECMKEKSYWDIMRSRFFLLLLFCCCSASFSLVLLLFFCAFCCGALTSHVCTWDATWVAWNVDSNSSKMFFFLDFQRTIRFIHTGDQCGKCFAGALLPAENLKFSAVHCRRVPPWKLQQRGWFESNDIIIVVEFIHFSFFSMLNFFSHNIEKPPRD